jgi:hypothetical protein
MPISPQITITPEDLVFKSFDITAVSKTSSTATYTATGHTFSAGDIVSVTGIAPDGYNGSFTITSIATNTFTVANTTNATITTATGNAYWADNTEYSYETNNYAYQTNSADVVDLTAAIDANATAAYNAAISAQADATAAQASASTAYNTAVAANTAASTAQTTADGKNKVTYSTSAPGSTSNVVGDIWYQYGSSGVNNGRIIAQYSGAGGTSWTQTTISGLVVANIDAGNITTGTLAVAVGITGTDGNFSLDAVTGAIVATKATITGTVNAKSGYFGDGTNGYSISSSGLTGIGSGVIIGGQIQTSTGNEAVVLDGSTNAIRFKSGGSYVGNIVPLNVGGSAYGLLMHYGATPDGSGGTRPQMYIGSSNVSISASASFNIGVSTSAISFNGATYSNSNFYVPNHSTTTSTANGYVNATTGLLARSTASSARYKEDIVNLVDVEDLDPRKLLTIPVRAFRFKKGYLTEGDEREGVLIPGFIAEEVDAVYPAGTDYDAGQVETWNDRTIIPGMLALIQSQETRIQALEGK